MVGPRDEIAGLEPYSWETPTWEIAGRYGLSPYDVVRLDLNTSPYRPVKWLRRLSRQLEGLGVNLYPDTSYRDLRELLNSYTGAEVQSIMVCNGADEAIDILCKAYVGAGREVLISSPTYSYFRVSAEIMGGQVVSVPRLPNFEDDVDGLLASVTRRTAAIFLCSPNNPTGNTMRGDSLKRVLDEFDGLVVVDEAYFEFCGQTSASLISSYDNLAVVRTFSKAWSLAGARVGYLLAGEDLMRTLNKVRPPNSLSVISLALASYALRDRRSMERWVGSIVGERERIFRELMRLEGVRPYPSEANFILMRFESVDAGWVHEMLIRSGLVLRNLSSSPQLRNCLRLTISTPQHNNAFLNRLRKLL
ncbi:MAG: histidinol-phosphate transaminase [Nitrososphaerota archaeon]